MTKISSLTALAAVDADTSADLVTVVDVSETGAARNKKQTLQVFFDTIIGLFGALAVKDTVNNADWSGADLGEENGGTAASTFAAARTNLDVYSKAEVDAIAAGGGYTDELAQDAVGTILADSSTIDFTYTDATPEITASVKAGSIGATELASTAVTPGSYTSADITVDADGRITAAANGSGASFATASDINTGTDTTKALNSDALAGSNLGTKEATVAASDMTTAITTGDGKAYFPVPSTYNGMNLIAARAVLDTAGTGGGFLCQLRRKRSGSDVDMLSTRISIDSGENDSLDAATPPAINASNDDVATGDRIYIDVDGVPTGGKGLIVEMQFRLP